VWPKTLAQWEDNFRRDAEPEQEIGVWCRIRVSVPKWTSTGTPVLLRAKLTVLFSQSTSLPFKLAMSP
jgi:hypothetical protein